MVLQAETRESLRAHIGYNLGPNVLYVSSASSNGDTTSLIDNTLRGGNDVHNGKWILLTSGNNDGEVTAVDDYAQTGTDCTLAPAISNGTSANDTYEMWEAKYHPTRINDFINQSIIAATRRVYDPVEDTSLFADGGSTRLAIPSNISVIYELSYRESYASKRIHAFGATFDETTVANITQALDTEDRKQGGQSLKLTIAAGASANDLITDSITSIDISKYTHLEFWAKSSITTSAADFHILLDDTAACASALETLAFPALTADTWAHVSVALSARESLTAIISVGYRYTQDVGACTVWLDDMRVVNNDSFVWQQIPGHLWSVDRNARDLILTGGAKSSIGYKMLKIRGGDKPALLTADTSTTEVSDDFVIAYATALALASQGDPKAGFWFDEAHRAKRRMPLLVGARMVE